MQAISTELWNMETIYSWDPDTVTNTNGFLHNICKFEFFISFFVTKRLLNSLCGLNSQTSEGSKDILQAHDQVTDVQLELELMKENCCLSRRGRQTDRTDLPSPQLLATEFHCWKSNFALMSSEMRPGTLQTALQHCDIDAFPNIRVLLLIACILPVTVCENERSNSQLRQLKTYLRATMSEE